MHTELQCPETACVLNHEYTNDEYAILAVFRGTVIGEISKLTVAPRRNSFTAIDDGRFCYLPCSNKPIESLNTVGSIVFAKYDYQKYLQRIADFGGNEIPTKFDVIISWRDKVIVVTGVAPVITNMINLQVGKEYKFRGNEEYHACNHCKEGK